MQKSEGLVPVIDVGKDKIGCDFYSIDQSIAAGGYPLKGLARRLPQFDVLPIPSIEPRLSIVHMDAATPAPPTQFGQRRLTGGLTKPYLHLVEEQIGPALGFISAAARGAEIMDRPRL
jgi:hypothetical protein